MDNYGQQARPRSHGLSHEASHGGIGAANTAVNIAAAPPSPQFRPLIDVAPSQRELHVNVVSLAIRLSNIASYLNGDALNVNNDTGAHTEYPEESAPINAIITRTINTQQHVLVCSDLAGLIETRLGIGGG